MKTLVCLVALACAAVAFPQREQQVAPTATEAPSPASGPSAPAGPNAATANAAAAPALPHQFYGPGLNNPLATPPDPRHIQVAQMIVKSHPNVRVRVLQTGQIEFTNEFGQNVDIQTRDGFHVHELFDPEEAFEIEQERREREFKLRQRQAEIRRQQQALAQLSQQLSGPGTAGTRGRTAPANNLAGAGQFNIVA